MNEILNKEIPIPKKLSIEARDMLKQVLKKNVSAATKIICLTLVINQLIPFVLLYHAA